MRLIDADALKAKLREGLEHYQYRPDDFAIGKVSGLVDAMEEVDRAPTVEAIPMEWMVSWINRHPNDLRCLWFAKVEMEWRKEHGSLYGIQAERG